GGTTYFVRVVDYFGSPRSWGFTLHAALRPSNDDLAGAQAIDHSSQLSLLPSYAATVDPAEPPWTCGTPQPSLWYRLVPPTTGTALITASSGLPAPSIAVFRGTSYGDMRLTACGLWGLQLQVIQGDALYLRLGARGFSALSVIYPASDAFATALDLELGISRPALTWGFTTEQGEPKGFSQMGSTAWYRFIPPGDGSLVLDTAGSADAAVGDVSRPPSRGPLHEHP